MKYVYAMGEAHDVEHVGGKAAALARLATAGFAPPEFFAISPAAFDESGLKPEAAGDLSRALSSLGPGPFAVRSSGRQEDGAAHSHAGQFLSRLNVPVAEVPAAAHEVWRSGFSESVVAYRRQHALDANDGAPAVIVQRMVPARAAGVVFTADPVAGRRDRMVVSATAGLADRLVSGEVDGVDYALDKATGVPSAPLEADGPLSARDLAGLADMARRIEAAMGAPQDIEWAFEADRLHVLQTRPITSRLSATPLPDATVTIFDNSNIVESYPGLVSPLTYSFAQYAYARVYRAFVGLLGVPEARVRANAAAFDNMLGRLDGRVYYNLINWYRCLALLPGFASNRAHMETMMGVGEPLPADIADRLAPPRPRGLSVVAEWGRIARMAWRMSLAAVRLQGTIRDFNRRLDAALGRAALDLETAPLTALAAEYRRIEAELLDRWDAPLVNDFLCMIAFGASRKLLERWLGAEGLALHNDVLIGQGDIVSAEPAQRIAALGREVSAAPGLSAALRRDGLAALAGHPGIRGGIDSYLAKFGDRCTEELKLESTTLDEDPTPLLLAIAAAAERPPQLERQTIDAGAKLKALFAGRPLRRSIAGLALSLAKARVRDRENLRFERTRVFGRARRIFMAMGRELAANGVIAEPGDVLMLTVQEVLGAIEGFSVSSNLEGLVAVRRAEMTRGRALADPPERVTITGAVACRRPASAEAQIAERSADTDGNGEARMGTGCSAGRIVGKARVVTDPRSQALEPGEILVARHTDPGWIAVFANASAIVVERGSLLSHSAIVARELGIPCVVGVKGATQWLATGDEIEVDGVSGSVRRHHG
ncbi:MAG: hypothetical protein KDJ41_03220 [Hyphomicrobiaceae bacterium]|nr:hypothetical protein [Hyphomicrobiaceae bacterium]